MKSDEVLEKIIMIIIKELNLKFPRIIEDTTLEDLGVYSLGKMQLILEIEDQFNVDVSEEDFYDTEDHSIRNLVNAVMKALSQKGEN